jgi:hypothetical protein
MMKWTDGLGTAILDSGGHLPPLRRGGADLVNKRGPLAAGHGNRRPLPAVLTVPDVDEVE